MLLNFSQEVIGCFFSSCRSSWPNQQGDPKLPKARRTLMRMTKSKSVHLMFLLALYAPTWIDAAFSTCLFKAQQFGLFCRSNHTLVIRMTCQRKIYGCHCFLFMFLGHVLFSPVLEVLCFVLAVCIDKIPFTHITHTSKLSHEC